MNLGFLAAGGLSAFALVWHVMTGRARPLSPPVQGETPDWSGLDAWFGRHVVTLMLAAMATGFSHAARDPNSRDVAVTLSALALGAAALRILAALRVGAPRADVREWALLAAAALAGFAGFLL